MEAFGLFSFIIVMCYMSYPKKVDKLERKIKRLEQGKDGANTMSKLISDLIGTECIVTLDVPLQTSTPVRIIDADDDWVKITYSTKKNEKKTQIIRIEDITKIEIV